MYINNNLKHCRETLNITQKELGKILNVKASTISGWENRYDYIPLEKLIKFCNIFKFNIDYVMGLKNVNENFVFLNINKEKIGNNLKKYRKIRNLTQTKLSQKLNISQSCYNQYECGKSTITTSILYAIVIFFNISVYDIIN